MITKEDIYWVLLSYESGLINRKFNAIIKYCYEEAKIGLADFYESLPEQLTELDFLTPEDNQKLLQSKELSVGQSFLLESLDNNQIQLIKSIDSIYPNRLKENLPNNHPPVLFTLGDIGMLDKKIVAIIGQRDAHPNNLLFARESAQYLTSQQIVIVSGFARGIDQEAYHGAIAGGGQTIVILAEGILSAKSAFRKIAAAIEEGQVLVLSQFHPNVNWQTGLAMARNQTVVGLADVTLIGQTKPDGGTWNSANAALKQKKPVFVYMNSESDLTGAKQLIQKGAIALEPSKNQSISDLLKPIIKICSGELILPTPKTEIQLELLPMEEKKKSKKKKL